MSEQERVCISGGALGSDLAWGAAAAARGFKVLHASFDGHVSKAPPETLARLTPEDLNLANPYIMRANKTLKRGDPSKRPLHVVRLLQRNWWQIQDTDSCYAIVETEFEDGTVAGGTGWAVQMYRDQLYARDPAIEELPLYVYNQTRRMWLQGANPVTVGDAWFVVEQQPPPPNGRWTGIGTRQLNKEGQEAIDHAWDGE